MIKIRWNYVWRYVRELVQTAMGKKIGKGRFNIINYNVGASIPYHRLIAMGFQPNYFAYYEKGELFNLRRLQFKERELWQEHIRIFEDEIRGHFEISYEEDTQRHISGETIKPLSPGLIGAIKRMV